jgi:beta-lactam-binding protein with PASTA domain
MSFLKVDSFKKVLVHLAIILMLFSGLLAFFFYIYLPEVTHHGETITVPKLVGMNVDELEKFLDAKKLRYKINDSTYNAGVKPNTVLTQHPLPDAKVKENRMIYITISAKNPPNVSMPNLIDYSLKGAQIQLNQHGLILDTIIEIPGKEGLVYGQFLGRNKIEPGTMIPKGTKIVLKVGKSSGQEVTIPDFVGMDVESARGLAQQEGLLLDIRPDPNVHTGYIIRQKPAAGQTLHSGETVDLWTE